MLRYIEQVKEMLHESPLDRIPLLGRFLESCIEVLTGPITGLRTAHYWVFIAIDLIVLTALFFVFLRSKADLQSQGFLHFCFPKEIWKNPSVRTDIKLIFANNFVMPMVNLTWRLTTVFFAAFLLNGMIAVFGPPLKIFEWNALTLIGFGFLLAFAEDLGFYLCHLASHKIPVLWAFHKVHHSAEVMTPLTTSRNHPVEFMLIPPAKALTASFALAPVLYLFSTPPSTIEVLGISLVSALFGFIGSHLNHSHIWLAFWPAAQRVVCCPAQHQIHHSSAPRHHDKNMAGVFTFWDWVFGTLYIAPRERESFALGVYGAAAQPHPSLTAAYVVPFFDAARAALPWLPAPLRSRCAALTDSVQARFERRQDVAAPPSLPIR